VGWNNDAIHEQAHVFLASEFPRFGVAPTERTYRAFVRMMTDKSRASRGKIDAALDLVHSMEQQGIQPTHDVRR
jgi:pentatricopeptide repeat protein